MVKTRKGLFLTFYHMGHDYEYYQPVRPGDTIRTWVLRPTLEDSTDLSGKGPRKFHYVDGQCNWINQRDEIIGAFKQYVEVTLHEGDPPVDKYFEEYGYTEKELDYLAEVFENEKPRGAELRYWEDANVGDDMGTTTDGPTTFVSIGLGGPPAPLGAVPSRTFTRYEEPLGGPVMMDMFQIGRPVSSILFTVAVTAMTVRHSSKAGHGPGSLTCSPDIPCAG